MRGKYWPNRLKKVLSMLVSLALAFCLWLALAGRETSTFDLTVPLELANLPGDLAIKTEVPGSVAIQVLANTAQGRFLADRKLHLWLNVASAREGGNTFQIADDLLDLPRGVQLRKITPSVIEFEAVKLSDKVVPVKPVVSGRVNGAYRVKSLVVEPDRVRLRGPADVMKNVEAMVTEPIVLDGISQSQTLMVALAADGSGSGMEITPKEIRVIINLEAIMEQKTFVNLPVEVDRKEAADGSRVTVSPDKATVTVTWPRSRVGGIAPGEIRPRVYVDEEKLRREGRLNLPVMVVPPEGATVVAIDPPNAAVTYLPPPTP